MKKIKHFNHKKLFQHKIDRARKITWFNPPFSRNVATNVGAKFLKIIDKCFPPSNPLAKIINRNTVKISYRCMPNMGQVINKHISKISKQNEAPPPIRNCNCQRGPLTCPVDGACLTRGVVYQATVTREDDQSQETYTGLTSRSFKERWDEHKADMRHINREGTGLSEYVWKLKTQNTPFNINWKILTRRQAFNPSKKSCDLCLTEKYYIMFRSEGATLNKRSEIFATCRHRLKPLLVNS